MPTAEQTVSMNDVDLSQETISVPQGTPEEFYAPPILDDGDHVGTIKFGDRGIKVNRQKDKQTNQRTGGAYINVHIQATTEGGAAFDNLTSIAFGDRGSPLQAMLRVAGFDAEVQRATNVASLRELTENVVSQSPTIGFTTQWEARGEDTTKPEGSKERYYTVLKGQKNFPPLLDENGNATGKFNPEVKDPKSGQLVRANVNIIRYFKA